MKKSEKSLRIEALQGANKEVRTLSGCIKLVQKFWASGYREAFAFSGLSCKEFTFENVLKIAQKEGNKVFETRKIARVDEKGNKVKEGKKNVYDLVNKEVKMWTPTALYYVLAQSNEMKEYR